MVEMKRGLGFLALALAAFAAWPQIALAAWPERVITLAAIGVEMVQSSPEGFGKTLRADTERYNKLIKELHITAE